MIKGYEFSTYSEWRRIENLLKAMEVSVAHFKPFIGLPIPIPFTRLVVKKKDTKN